MALRYADRVKHATLSVGTGALVIGQAPVGHQSFAQAGFVVGDTMTVLIQDPISNAWETARATLVGADTISRDTTYDSSADGARVDFGPGVKWVTLVVPALEVGRFADSVVDMDTAPAEELTGSEIRGVYQDSQHRRTTLMDEVRFHAAKGAGRVFQNMAQAAALVAALALPLGSLIATECRASPDDGGDGVFERVASPPAHLAAFQDTSNAWWACRSALVRPEQDGAKADGVFNSTAAIKSAFSRVTRPGQAVEFRTGGTYCITDAVLPNVGGDGCTLFCNGVARIKAVAGSATNYVLASNAYANNSSFASGRMRWTGIMVDASYIKDYAVAYCAWDSHFYSCKFQYANVANFLHSARTLNGNGPRAVGDNNWVKCWFNDGAGNGFENTSEALDFHLIACTMKGNVGLGAHIRGSAGCQMTGCNIYDNDAGSVRFDAYGFGSRVIGNTFNGDVTLYTISTPNQAAQFGPGNMIQDGNLIVRGGGGGGDFTDIRIVDCRLQDNARFVHAYNGGSRRCWIDGGSSHALNPFVWEEGNNNGRIIISEPHYSQAAGGMLLGEVQHPGPGGYTAGLARTQDEATLLLTEGGTQTDVNINLVVPPMQLAGSKLEVEVFITNLQTGGADMATYQLKLVAQYARKKDEALARSFVLIRDEVCDPPDSISVEPLWIASVGTGAHNAVLRLRFAHQAPSAPGNADILVKVAAVHRFTSFMEIVRS
jgi:hypothetical protein